MWDTRTASLAEAGSPQAVIEVDPVQLVVAETYSDTDLDIVHAKLGGVVSVKMLGGDATVELATDSAVMVSTDDVVLVAMIVDREAGLSGTGATRPLPESSEIISRARKAVNAAADALHWVKADSD